MKVTAKLEDCEITVDDGNAAEPASSRWKDQHERIKDMVVTAQDACIKLHQQKITDV